MKHAPASRRRIRSAAIVPTLWVMVGCFGVAALVSLQAQPGWWGPQDAVNSNLTKNDYAVANQGQLKKFTVAAVNQLNATLTNSGGAGPALSNMIYNWHQDYLTNGYATNTANASYPYKPSDLQAVNVGQLKYIASLVYSQLASAGYSGLYPSWITQNTATDNTAANLGQLKQVFNFDLSVAPGAVSNLALSANNANEIDLSWTLPAVNNASSIQVAISSDGGTTWTTTTLAAAATSYAATGLIAGQSYLFRVTASNSVGLSAPVSSSSPVTASAAAPALVSATLGAGNSVNFSWSEGNTNGVSGYNILQSTNGGASFASVGSAGAGAGSVTLSGLSGAMDTSQFEITASAGPVTSTSSPITPIASATNDTDGDGSNDNVDGWAGFTDPTQEAKLAPPRMPNPSYVAVTISTIPTNYVVDYVNAQGQAVVHDPTQTLTATNSYNSIYGSSGTYIYQQYCFWDKGATNAVALPVIQAGQANSNGIYTRNITGLSDAGTVIGVDCFPYGGGNINGFSGRQQAWRWTSGMTQMQYLADMDSSIGTGTGTGPSGVSDGYFATIPYFVQTFNGTEEILACHEQMDPSASNNWVKSYIEKWTTGASSSTSSPQVYPYIGFTSANDEINTSLLSPPFGSDTILDANSHESRLASADNGNGTTIGFGAHLERYDYYDDSHTSYFSWDLNGIVTSGQSTLTLDPVGGGMIVIGAYRQWINGALAAVNANGQVLGLQNSTSPANPVINTETYNILPYQGLSRYSPGTPPYPYSYNPNVPVPYYAYNDPASVPYPVIWVPQTSGGNVIGYTQVTLTMPQGGMSFKGNAGMFFNKNFQIAGGTLNTGALDTPFLWQNYQYHHLSDFFPGLSGYAKFQVKGLDDNGAITAIATPNATQANPNPNQEIVQLLNIGITPSVIPTSGVARAKLVFGTGIQVPVIPQSNTQFSIAIGGQSCTDIHQDENNPNIFYFAVPPSTGGAGTFDVVVNGISVPGIPCLSASPPTPLTLPQVVQYTADSVKGMQGFSSSNVVSIDEDKSTIDWQVQQGGITSAQAPNIFSEMRADLASTQGPLFDQFFATQSLDPGALATLQQQAQTELTIFDTVYPPPNAGSGSNATTGVSIFASIPGAYETGPASGMFTVTRPAASASSLTVNYTISGTAVNGTDYTTLSGSVVIPANQTSAQISVAPVQHALGANKTVVLTLSSSANYAINSNYAADTVTIYDYGNGVTSNTVLKENTSLVALNQALPSKLSNLFSSQFFLGSSPRFMSVNSSALFALVIGQTSPPPVPQLGSPTFFADVKSRLTATGAGIFYVHNISVATGTVPIHCYVLNADNYHLSSHQASAVGNVINQAVADNPNASVIVNGAQFSYHCGDPGLKTWVRSWFQTSAPAEPFSTMGVVIHNGSTLSTSTNGSKGSWLTAIARYWVGESTAANKGVAASYLFGHGTPTASATPEAMGGLTSFLWQNIAQTPTGTPGAIHTDKDLSAYTSLGHGILTGFNIIGVNYASGMVIILNKDNGVPGNLLDFQAPLIASGVDYAELTDGSASVGCWSKTEGYVSLGARQKQPVDQVNTVTSYLIFSHN